MILLGGAAFYLGRRDKQTDYMRSVLEERDFTVANEGDIHKVFIAHKTKAPYTLTRKGDAWYMNDSIRVNPYIIPNILAVLTKAEIDHIPTKAASATAIESMKNNGIKVEVYGRTKKLKTIYVGSDVRAGKGTYMLLDGATQPYAMRLPMVKGGFRNRLVQDVQSLKDPTLIDYQASDIQRIKVSYPKDQKSSFELKVDGDAYLVNTVDQYQERSTKPVNQAFARAYVEGLEEVKIEGWDMESPHLDSIKSVLPFSVMEFEQRNGQTEVLKFYPFKDFLNENVHAEEWEQSKMISRYYVLNKAGELSVVQQRLVGTLMRPYSFFFSE